MHVQTVTIGKINGNDVMRPESATIAIGNDIGYGANKRWQNCGIPTDVFTFGCCEHCPHFIAKIIGH
jgi:hypothetical protein